MTREEALAKLAPHGDPVFTSKLVECLSLMGLLLPAATRPVVRVEPTEPAEEDVERALEEGRRKARIPRSRR